MTLPKFRRLPGLGWIGTGILSCIMAVSHPSLAQPVQGRLGSVRDSNSASEPATRPVTGTDLSSQATDGPVLSPYLILKPPASQPGTETRPYSEVEYGRIVRSLMKVGGIPLAINYTTGQSILPDGFERSSLKAGTEIRSIRTKAIDVLDRGIIVVPTREAVRLRGVRIPSQFTGPEASRGSGRECVRILRDIIRSGEVDLMPGVPVRDSSGAILVDLVLSNGESLNRRFVSEGLAMWEPSDFDAASAADGAILQKLQSQARRERLGLWGRR